MPVTQPSIRTASQPPATQPPEQQQLTVTNLISTAPPSYDQAMDHTTINLNGESASPPMATLPSYEDLTISATADNSSEALSPQPQEQGETNWVTSIQNGDGDTSNILSVRAHLPSYDELNIAQPDNNNQPYSAQPQDETVPPPTETVRDGGQFSDEQNTQQY